MNFTIQSGCAALAIAAVLLSSRSNAQLTSYSQDFESLNMADGGALGAAGFISNGLVFDGGGGFKFFYGNFPSPNGGPGFSAIATGEAGPSQGQQYINTYSDYNCCGAGSTNEGHFNGTDLVQSFVFQEQTIATSDVGTIALFTFDGKLPSDPMDAAASPSTAEAFIRTLDPNAGFSTSSEMAFDSTLLSSTVWTTQALPLPITAALDGHILQFGFRSQSSDFDSTGVYYDNLSFSAIPEPTSLGLFALGMAGLLGSRRRK